MTVCLFTELFNPRNNPIPFQMLADMNEFLAQPLTFSYVPPGYISYSEKSEYSVEDIEDGNLKKVTRVATRTFVMEDGDEFVHAQKDTREFELPTPFPGDEESDVLSEFSSYKGTPEKAVEENELPNEEN